MLTRVAGRALAGRHWVRSQCRALNPFSARGSAASPSTCFLRSAQVAHSTAASTTSSSSNAFSPADHNMWARLWREQTPSVQNLAVPEYVDLLPEFRQLAGSIPTPAQISDILRPVCGWEVVATDCILDNASYFDLLVERKFPVNMTVRNTLGFCPDPDLFHEVFGHCVMLLSPEYGDFLRDFALYASTRSDQEVWLLARLLWFTTECGLVMGDGQIQTLGAALLSSPEEALYALNSPKPTREYVSDELRWVSVDGQPSLVNPGLVSIFRQPYRANHNQVHYFIFRNLQQIYSLLDDKPLLERSMKAACALGEREALFDVVPDCPYSNVGWCGQTPQHRTNC